MKFIFYFFKLEIFLLATFSLVSAGVSETASAGSSRGMIELHISQQALDSRACLAGLTTPGGFVPVPALVIGSATNFGASQSGEIAIKLEPIFLTKVLTAKKKDSDPKTPRGKNRRDTRLPLSETHDDGPAGFYDTPRDRDYSPTYGYDDYGYSDTGAAYLDSNQALGPLLFFKPTNQISARGEDKSFYTDPPGVRDSDFPSRGQRPDQNTDDRLPGGGSDRYPDPDAGPTYHDPAGYGEGDGPDPAIFGHNANAAILHLPNGTSVQGVMFQ